MELQQIRAFLAVAEELHFGRAAERLGMAQPPLSRSIRQFEKELGAELFHRTTRQVSLAPAGEALMGPARALLAAADSAVQSVRFTTTGDIGRVRLGFGGLSSHPLVAALLRETRARRPGIAFALESSVYTDHAVARLSDGTLDLALMRWQSQPPHIVGRPVMVEKPVVAVYAGHRLAARTSVTMDELRDEDLVLLQPDSGSTMRELTLRWCYRAGFTPTVVQEVPDAWMIGTLVSAGLGIAVTYDSVIANFSDADMVTLPLDVEHDPILVHLAHRDAPESPALREVLAIAEDVLPTIGVPGA